MHGSSPRLGETRRGKQKTPSSRIMRKDGVRRDTTLVEVIADLLSVAATILIDSATLMERQGKIHRVTLTPCYLVRFNREGVS